MCVFISKSAVLRGGPGLKLRLNSSDKLKRVVFRTGHVRAVVKLIYEQFCSTHGMFLWCRKLGFVKVWTFNVLFLQVCVSVSLEDMSHDVSHVCVCLFGCNVLSAVLLIVLYVPDVIVM